MTFQEWFNGAPHRAKYSNDHPAYLAAQEAWNAANDAAQHRINRLNAEIEAWKVRFKIAEDALAKLNGHEQKPVAWMDGYRNIYSLEEKAAGCPEATIALVPMANHKKTSGSPINEIQCVCGAVWLGEEMVHLPDKRPPASKPWVGLTDDERWEAAEHSEDNMFSYASAIEAKLREKNAQPSKPLPFNKDDMEGLDINQRLAFKLGWRSAEQAHGIKGEA